MRAAWLALVACAAAAAAAPEEAAGGAGAPGYLLPGDVRPSHYDVMLAFDVNATNKFPFFGVVSILIKAVNQTDKIVLHAKGYTIAEDKVQLSAVAAGGAGGETPAVTKVDLNDTYNFLTLSLSKELQEGASYRLTIPFSGNLKSELEGVYISEYKEDGVDQYLIATQFEAISARKGFPCWDEPAYKASFTVALGHARAFTAVSNMPQTKSSSDNPLEPYWPWSKISETFKYRLDSQAYTFTHFAQSVPMSTYLVAWVVSRFQHVTSPKHLAKPEFRIWARRDAVNQTEYASIIGPKVLTYFEEWFGVPYPLPKSDMIAIPDFAAGAMENWGLITYRETALLYDKEQSSLSNKERVAEVIAHELAHQWFGNLVTMRWWSDLWLNEGFATYMSSVGVDGVESTWGTARTDAAAHHAAVLALDALQTSHPVSVEITDPARISEIFDEISYRKGAALVRMMRMFLGEEVFRKAIHNYLIKHSYSNAEQDDLWAELTAAATAQALPRGVTVKTVMDSWTTQTGYPLLTVVRDYEGQSVGVTQKRYLSLGTANSSASWWVPLNLLVPGAGGAGGRDQEPLQWLSDEEGVASEHRFKHAAKSNQWLLFNADMMAVYRVNYDARNWRLLSESLNSAAYRAVPELSRVQLIRDVCALAWTNVVDYDTALGLLKYLRMETEYLPLMTGLSALAQIDTVLLRTPEYGTFQSFVRSLVAPAYERAGGLYAKSIRDEDDILAVKMQVLTSRWACQSGVAGCEDNAIELFDRWMDSDSPDEDNPIPLDLRSTVYTVAVARGDAGRWRWLLARARAANVAAARLAMMHALARTTQPHLLQLYLTWAITDGSVVRRQDSAMVVSAVLRAPAGYYVARDFFYTRYQDVLKAFSGQARRVGSIIKTMLEQFTTQRELDQFLEWKKENEKSLEEIKLSVEQAVEKARVNIAWLGRNKDQVIKKLEEFAE